MKNTLYTLMLAMTLITTTHASIGSLSASTREESQTYLRDLRRCQGAVIALQDNIEFISTAYEIESAKGDSNVNPRVLHNLESEIRYKTDELNSLISKPVAECSDEF